MTITMISSERARFVPGPRRGDQRRDALLRGLETLLATHPLNEIGIADISRAAGATRSAFYFYFPTKGAAVAALLSDVYEDLEQAAAAWYDAGPGTPIERIRVALEMSTTVWREHAAVLVAMFDAVGTDTDARQLWTNWVDTLISRATERISDERAAGLARQVCDPQEVATVLMGAALSVIERDVRAITAGRPPLDDLIATLVEIWYNAVYPDRGDRSHAAQDCR